MLLYWSIIIASGCFWDYPSPHIFLVYCSFHWGLIILPEPRHTADFIADSSLTVQPGSRLWRIVKWSRSSDETKLSIILALARIFPRILSWHNVIIMAGLNLCPIPPNNQRSVTSFMQKLCSLEKKTALNRAPLSISWMFRLLAVGRLLFLCSSNWAMAQIWCLPLLMSSLLCVCPVVSPPLLLSTSSLSSLERMGRRFFSWEKCYRSGNGRIPQLAIFEL